VKLWLAVVVRIMKSFSKKVTPPAYVTSWSPAELVPPVKPQVTVDTDELLAMFKGDLPMRPSTGLKGASGLISSRKTSCFTDATTLAWKPEEIMPGPTPRYGPVVLPEIQMPVRKGEMVVEQAVAVAKPVDLTTVKELEDKAAQLFAEAHKDRETAERLVEEAKRQSEAIIQQAKVEAEIRYKQAYEQGLAQAEAELATTIQAAKAIITETNKWRAGLLARSEQDVVELMKDMARNLFSEGVLIDAAVMQETFTKVVMRARSLGNLKIFMHPDDAARIDPAWVEFQVTISGQRIQIIPTESIKRGGCFIDGDQGAVDARIDTRLDALMNVFES
jgi:flagellar assembly protein FliH